MGTKYLAPTPNPYDLNAIRRSIQQLAKKLGPDGSPKITELTISGLTASRLVASDANKKLISTDLDAWIAGTANQITVTDDADGTVTLSLPQDIHTGASPTFAAITISGAGSIGDGLTVNANHSTQQHLSLHGTALLSGSIQWMYSADNVAGYTFAARVPNVNYFVWDNQAQASLGDLGVAWVSFGDGSAHFSGDLDTDGDFVVDGHSAFGNAAAIDAAIASLVMEDVIATSSFTTLLYNLNWEGTSNNEGVLRGSASNVRIHPSGTGNKGNIAAIEVHKGQLAVNWTATSPADITDAIIFYSVLAANAAYTGTITNLSLFQGIAVDDTVTITNAYGLLLDDITGGTNSNYAIKTGLGDVYFGDDVTCNGTLTLENGESIDNATNNRIDINAKRMQIVGDGTNAILNLGGNDVFRKTDADAWVGTVPGAALAYYIFEAAGNDKNPEVRIYGYPDGESKKYGCFQIVSGPKFQISSDSGIIDFADENITMSGGTLKIKEVAAAIADTAAYGQIWVKTAAPNELWFTNDDGTDIRLGADGGTLTTVDSESNTFLVSHAYLAQTSGFVYANIVGASATLRGYVGTTDDPAGAGVLLQIVSTTATSTSAIAFFVPAGQYFEITTTAGTPTIFWQSLVSGGAAPIDQD